MARILKAICLLLIGGGIGAFAAGGGDGATKGITDISQGQAQVPSSTLAFEEASHTASGAHAFPPAEVTEYVALAGHRALAIRTSGAEEPTGQKADRLARVRLAQAPGRMSDAPPPLPRVRPLPVRAGDADTIAKGDERTAEARLAEAIQKELKRVGCYAGNIDGDWGAETRRAMRAFNDRVNATLPVEQPDYILLTLLQGHSARACGAACPPGQEISGGGKCLPRSVIAEERRRLAAERAAASQTARAGVALSSAPAVEKSVPPPGDARGSVPPSSASQGQADRAEIERQRINAAEERRRKIAVEAAANAEQERLERLEAAEKARALAEARRRDEIAALAARAAQRAAAAAASRPISSAGTSFVTGSDATVLPPPPLPVRPSQAFRQQVVASRYALMPEIETAAPHRQNASQRHRQQRPPAARYAGRLMPPPAYRVGRMPAVGTAGTRMFAYEAPRPTHRSRYNPQAIFRELQHRMP